MGDALAELVSLSPSALQGPMKMMPGIFMYSLSLLPVLEASAGVGGGGKAGSDPYCSGSGRVFSLLQEQGLGHFLVMMVEFRNYRAETLQQQDFPLQQFLGRKANKELE